MEQTGIQPIDDEVFVDEEHKRMWEIIREQQKLVAVLVDQINESVNAINGINKELKSLRGMVFLGMKKKKEV